MLHDEYDSRDPNYDPLSFIISFPNYKREIFEEILSRKLSSTNLDSYRLFIHEYRHYLDHISTFYGHQYIYDLSIIFNNIINKHKVELSSIHPIGIGKRISELYSNLPPKRLKSTNDEVIWHLNFKLERFHEIMIFKLEFIDRENNEIVCSSPVTFISLFECNSILEEMTLVKYVLDTELKHDDDRSYRQFLAFREFTLNAYDTSLIEYSVAAHIIACIFEIPDVFMAYQITSRIGTFLLNCTKEILQKIASFQKIIISAPHSNLVENRDFGYLLYYLCLAYKERFFKLDKIFDFEDFLHFFQLPSQDEILKLISTNSQNLIAQIHSGNYFREIMINKISLGLQALNKRGIDGSKFSSFEFWDNIDFRTFTLCGNDEWDRSTDLDKLLARNPIQLKGNEWHDLIDILKKLEPQLK